MRTILALVVLIGLLSFAPGVRADPTTQLHPVAAFVPTADVAIAIAVAVWGPIYGADQIAQEKPYHAVLKDGVWFISSSLPRGHIGGVAELPFGGDSFEVGWPNHLGVTNVPSTTLLRYRFLSTSRIIGFSTLVDGRDVDFDTGDPNSRAFLTLDRNPSLAPIDRHVSLLYLMWHGFEGLKEGTDIVARIEALREERAQKRRKESGTGVFLIVAVRGEVTSTNTEITRDLGAAVIANEAVDKAPINEHH